MTHHASANPLSLFLFLLLLGIYRAGAAPLWRPDAAAASSPVTPALQTSNQQEEKISSVDGVDDDALVDRMKQRLKSDLHHAASGAIGARRVVHHAAIVQTGGGSNRATFEARITEGRSATAGEIDEDGDACMEDAASDREEDGDHRRRRRPIEAAIIIPTHTHAAAAAQAPDDQTVQVKIDASQLEVPEPAASDDDDEADVALARRRRARANAAAREAEEEARMQEEARKKAAEDAQLDDEDEDDEEDDESEYDSDSSEEARRMMFKPIFRSKAQRDTLAERDRIAAEEEAAALAAEERKASRKKEAKLAVLTILQKEVAAQAAKEAEAQDSDAEGLEEGDELDEQLQLDLWKLRELRRLKRDSDAKKVFDEEAARTERRRHMTDEEIRIDNERLGLDRTSGTSKKEGGSNLRFMQRYFHKGGFYQDDDSRAALGELATRDYQQPTGQDRTVDKTTLPQVMQVKNFAMKGRTKCKEQHETGFCKRMVVPCVYSPSTTPLFSCVCALSFFFFLFRHPFG